jgi:hypothetical protein
VSLAGAVLVAASPVRPVQPVGPVSPGWRDDSVAQEPQQLRDGDGAQVKVTATWHSAMPPAGPLYRGGSDCRILIVSHNPS